MTFFAIEMQMCIRIIAFTFAATEFVHLYCTSVFKSINHIMLCK